MLVSLEGGVFSYKLKTEGERIEYIPNRVYKSIVLTFFSMSKCLFYDFRLNLKIKIH